MGFYCVDKETERIGAGRAESGLSFTRGSCAGLSNAGEVRPGAAADLSEDKPAKSKVLAEECQLRG